MSVHGEAAFESSIEAHLLDNGWISTDPQAYDRKLGLFPDEFMAFIEASQPKEWKKLQTAAGGEQAARQKMLKWLADQIDQRGTIDVLRGVVKNSGVSLRTAFFRPANTLTPELGEKYAANRLSVTRQLHHSESNTADSLDLVLAINGIPVATAELKNPLTQQNVEQAMEQYRSDRNPADLIFAKRTLVHFAVDPHRVHMTTKLAKQETWFLPFNQGTGGPGRTGGDGNPANPAGYQTAYLWEQVWEREAWLDLLASYIHVSDGTTLFPRYHQWHAVKSILAATLTDGAGTDRLIQHSAGSGKSNTIAWAAHSLSRLHNDDDQPIFDKVVIITDRVVLDRQLQETVAGLDHTPGTIVRIDKHSSQLREALAGNAARVIITTLQKFPVIAETANEIAGRNFAIIVDEAHSSTSGDAIKQMKKVLSSGKTAEETLALAESIEAALEESVPDDVDSILDSAESRGKHPNLSFFAFTATPKPKTLNLFGEKTVVNGEKVHRPFHLYSMRQAIEEEFILDVLRFYTTYATYYKLANTDPREDPDVPTSKASTALARFVSLHPHNLGQKAEIIVEHFRQKTAAKIGGHAKAMVVTRSRLHAVRYKEAIDSYIAKKGYDKGSSPLRTLVAFSGTVTDPEQSEVLYTEAAMNGFGETQLPKRFAGDDYQVLVVAEKYQTGFDQPLLHTMYVDKKLSGVRAVQTLSRLNRQHPGKEETFVLDFANTADEIQDAFRPFFEETLAAPTDPNMLYTLEHEILSTGIIAPAEMRAAAEALLSGDPAQQKVIYANIAPAVTRFEALDEADQEKFRDALTSYVRAYVFLAQIMPWTEAGLEELYLYGKWLQLELPRGEGEPVPMLSKSVQLTHLRTAITSETDASLDEGTDEPGVALPGGGKGKQAESPMDKLSALIASLNEKFGMALTDADKVWFEQQKVAVQLDDDMKLIALNNDKTQYKIALEHKASDMIVDRHEANGVLFDTFFSNPEFKDFFLEYLGGTYEEFRARA